MKQRVGLINHGVGNIGSVANALEALELDWIPIERAEDFNLASQLILPGVGSFPAVMSALESRNLVEPLRLWATEGHHLLGICAGMQVLATRGFEFKETLGLGLVPGSVEIMDVLPLPTPQLGFNTVTWTELSLGQGPDFGPDIDYYFLNSYHFNPSDEGCVEAWYHYGKRFAATVRVGNVVGVQFHPEKSQRSGLRTLRYLLNVP